MAPNVLFRHISRPYEDSNSIRIFHTIGRLMRAAYLSQYSEHELLNISRVSKFEHQRLAKGSLTMLSLRGRSKPELR